MFAKPLTSLVFTVASFVIVFSPPTLLANSKCNHFPELSETIAVGAAHANSFTESDFNRLIDQVEKIYKPIFTSQGLKIEVDRKWDNSIANAYAEVTPEGHRKITLLGGLFRAKGIDTDAYTIVICHEIGHHLGGAPKYRGESWASVEGQADYFATLKCTRELWKNDDNIQIISKIWVSPAIQSSCSKAYPTPADAALCMRSILASEKLWRTMYQARSIDSTSLQDWENRSPKTEDPFKYIPKTETDPLHPSSTCRLESSFAGALCVNGPDLPLNSNDYKNSGCSIRTGQLSGARPLCWFGISDLLKSERPSKDQAKKILKDLFNRLGK